MIEDKYYGAEKGVEACTIFGIGAANEMGKIIDQCKITDGNINNIAGTNQSIAHKAGFVAEEVHAETYNFDAILKDKNSRAFTDRYKNSPLKRNDPVNDIIIMEDGKQVHGAQVKYYKNGQKTANAMREVKDGATKYKDTDSHIGPSDQQKDIKTHARRTELSNKTKRPEVAAAAKDVQKKSTNRAKHDGVESKPLSKKEPETIAQNNDKGKGAHRKIQNEYKNKSTIKQGLKAAKSAAVITSVIAGTINTISCLNEVSKGKMSQTEAVKYILKNTAIAATDSAIKAAAGTVAVSYVARTIPELFQVSALQSSFVTGSVAGAAVCAVDFVECIVAVAAGKMTMAELETRTGKNIFQTGAGVIGSTIGGALGAPGGPVGIMIGSIAGAVISSVAMTVAIDNHIEKPFKEIMENTSSLVQAGQIMQNSVSYLEIAQSTFEGFRIGVAISEKDFSDQMDKVQKNGDIMWDKINRMK